MTDIDGVVSGIGVRCLYGFQDKKKRDEGEESHDHKLADEYRPVKTTVKVLFLGALMLICCGWGFYAHQKINRLAVFTLPPEMSGFYKKNIAYLTEAATHPDNRRYIGADEAPRHFIDMDEYGDSAKFKLPKYWSEAVVKYGEDSLKKHGIVPWHIVRMFNQLKEAFML